MSARRGDGRVLVVRITGTFVLNNSSMKSHPEGLVLTMKYLSKYENPP